MMPSLIEIPRLYLSAPVVRHHGCGTSRVRFEKVYQIENRMIRIALGEDVLSGWGLKGGGEGDAKQAAKRLSQAIDGRGEL